MNLLSKRGYIIINSGGHSQLPILTVELVEKWYNLILICSDGTIEEVFFPTSDKTTSFVDHCPNPIVVEKYARKKGYHLDILAFEMMIGRWEMEVKDNYCSYYDQEPVD